MAWKNAGHLQQLTRKKGTLTPHRKVYKPTPVLTCRIGKCACPCGLSKRLLRSGTFARRVN